MAAKFNARLVDMGHPQCSRALIAAITPFAHASLHIGALPCSDESRTRRFIGQPPLKMKRALLAGIAALLLASGAAHARPELSKEQSWKLVLGTWCVNNQPYNKAYVGIGGTKCGEDEQKLFLEENGYRWEEEDVLSCRYLSGKARIDNTIPASTTTLGVWVFRIVADCMRPAEGKTRKYKQSFDMYVSKGALRIESLRSDEKP
jgi:hypothetical protein